MSDLFGEVPPPPAPKRKSAKTAPLADQLRPRTLDDIIGQDQVLGPDGPVRAMLEAHSLPSLVLWGPPGCGKTTLARLLADAVGRPMQAISAVMSGVAELRKIYDEADKRARAGQHLVLFIDEIHRFNRAQQDGLLAQVEDGTVTLIGATTENPSFALTPALLSRCQVLVLEPLDAPALGTLLDRALHTLGDRLAFDDAARAQLIAYADGDGRYLLNMIETVASTFKGSGTIGVDDLTKLLQRRRPRYDRAQESHYNLISALHKSVRGSDPDAALYWLCRMLDGGEDPRYLARRLVRMASEDIGLADPAALTHAIAAAEAYERLGTPEGELALAQITVHLACAPKSNALYTAYKQAMAVAKKSGSLMPPLHSLNAPTGLMRELGYGEGYAYDHDSPEAFSGQNYFPDTLERVDFYQPTGRGAEARLAERLAQWRRQRTTKARS
ncbi:MAG: replication-associated recombination protein A [Geminicoccaceae bacterium]